MANKYEKAGEALADLMSNIKFIPNLFFLGFIGDAPPATREKAWQFGQGVLYSIWQDIQTHREFPLTTPMPPYSAATIAEAERMYGK